MKKPYSREVRTKLERLQMQLDAERDRAEKAWTHLRELIYENVADECAAAIRNRN
jgi:hypothetical protein